MTLTISASAGEAELFGHTVDARDLAARRRVGYMSQSFSLYGELTVQHNMELHAQLFQLPAAQRQARLQALIQRFELTQ
mgnify:CR=1 FL=1